MNSLFTPKELEVIEAARKRNVHLGEWMESCPISQESAEQCVYDVNDILEILDALVKRTSPTLTSEQTEKLEEIRKIISNASEIDNAISSGAIDDVKFLINLIDFLVVQVKPKQFTDEQIAKEFWLRGYMEAHREHGEKPEMFEDGFSSDWSDQYGNDFTEEGAFTGKMEFSP